MYEIKNSRLYMDYDEFLKLPGEYQKEVQYMYCMKCGKVSANIDEWVARNSDCKIECFISLLY